MASDREVNAASVKIPEFWSKSPEVWFAKVEAQFGTKNITQDQTKYDYVVSALDMETAEEIQAILLHPPAKEKYHSLKTMLISTFGKSQIQKDMELLNLNGLGDRKPTALLRKINALNDDPQTLKRALFLTNLPSEMRTILAAQNIADIQALAKAADNVWEARFAAGSRQTVDSVETEIQETNRETVSPVTYAAKSRRPIQQPTPDRNFHKTFKEKNSSRPISHSRRQAHICYYHTRFGTDARRCEAGCKFMPLFSQSSQQGNGPVGC